MDLREIGWGSVDWIQLAQDRDRWWAVVNTVMNLRVLAPRSLLLLLLLLLCKFTFNKSFFFRNQVINLLKIF
jgi:hypothetical protein